MAEKSNFYILLKVMKELNGLELSLFIKERQAKEVRRLKQSEGLVPKLVIVRTNNNPVTDLYLRIKQQYGADIGVAVEVISVEDEVAVDEISKLNRDDSVHGIIVQLPLKEVSLTDQILSTVSVDKDVDGLNINSKFDPATPTAINWLLSGYDISLNGKKIVIVGLGRLVGEPLQKIWLESGLNVIGLDDTTKDLKTHLVDADIVVTATGVPGLITEDMLMTGAVVVDAGASTDKNGVVGDLAANVRQRDDLILTPVKGGVGPLTVAALFENLLRAAREIK